MTDFQALRKRSVGVALLQFFSPLRESIQRDRGSATKGDAGGIVGEQLIDMLPGQFQYRQRFFATPGESQKFGPESRFTNVVVPQPRV